MTLLYELTNFEMELRNERAMNACVKVANFPYIKTFEDFDFSYQPSISKEQILDFRNLRFMEKTENILLIGTPGVGKTHLATSIGIEAAKNRNSTYFINCNDLILQLKRAHLENRLETRLKFFAKYKLYERNIPDLKPFEYSVQMKADTSYRVTWWDTRAADKIAVGVIKSDANASLKLRTPPFKYDVACAIEEIKQN